MQVQLAGEPQKPGRTSEDFAAASPEALVLLDGSSSPDAMESGCRHGTAWYVRRLGVHLLALHGSSLEYLVLGDSMLVLQFKDDSVGNRSTSCGAGAAQVEVVSTYDTAGNKLNLGFTNAGSVAATVTVTDNAYGTGGPWTYSVPAGTTASAPVSASFETNRGWYDLTITANTSDGFLRRLAGHIENGADSISDPGPSGSTPPPPAALVNGDFETGSLTGWTAVGATGVVNSGAHSGTYAAQLGSSAPTNGDSSISQTFTVPSGKAQLSFWYSMTSTDTVQYDWATAALQDNTAGTGTTPLPKTCTNGAGWVQVTAPVTAGHSYTLTLTSHDDNYSGDPTLTLFDDVMLA